MRLLRALVLLALLAWAGPAWATWTFGACTDGGNSNAVTRSVTAGDLLITVHISGLSSDNPNLSDGGVNTWTKIGTTLSDSSNNNALSWWWAKAATTASITATASPVSGTAEGIAMCEWSSNVGVATSALETSAQNTTHFVSGSGSSATDGDDSTTVSAPANNGDLMLSFIIDTQAGTATFTQGTGFTKRFTGTSGNPINVEEFIQSSAAAKDATWTASSTNAYGCAAAFFKETASAQTTIPQRTMTGVGL